MGDEIFVQPGGLVARAPHRIGLRGATAYRTSAFTIDGFQNLVSLDGQTAVPFSNRTNDALGITATLLLGGSVVGSGNTVDVARQNLLGQMFHANRDASFIPQVPVFNSEIGGRPTTGLLYGAFSEPFTTAGTVTVTAASNIFVGAGTTWTADNLTGGYLTAGFEAHRKIQRGDLIGVNDGGAAAKNWFRIIEVTDNTHLVVYPTPTAGNASIGAGRGYQIIRTGYGGYSRGVPMELSDGNIYWYYCGGQYNTLPNPQAGHGTIQAVRFTTPVSHYMGPQLTDTLGAATTFCPVADDLVYYKGYMVYGGGTVVGWSKVGFPNAVPFADADFPARNNTVVAANDKFVSFEWIGDQLVALFEESFWLVSFTSSVPEFAFYRLPEQIAVIHAARAEPCGMAQSYVFGRPSCSGRGSVFYFSNRGVEQLPSGLADEVSLPIADVLANAFDLPFADLAVVFLSWSEDFDLVHFRPAWGELGRTLVYNPQAKDWSTFQLVPPQGRSIVGITGGVPQASRVNDIGRRWHIGYYMTLTDAGIPGTNGGVVATVAGSPDITAFMSWPALTTWKWRTPVIPCGMVYPMMSFGGFLPDMWTGPNSVPTSVSWTLYGGSSPYNMVQRDSGTLSLPVPAGTDFANGWPDSRHRLGKKTDDAFLMLEFSSMGWVAISGAVLFDSKTQVKR